MKNKFNLTRVKCAAGSVLLLIAIHAPLSARAQGTAFTYQGRLNDGANVANGKYDLKFEVFSAPIGGVSQDACTNFAVAVTNGLFTTTLDFGGYPDGRLVWFELSVRTNGGAAFTTLTPRQQVTPTPYAMFANTASNLVGSITATQVSGTMPLTSLPAALITNGQAGVNLSGAFAGNGSGLTNVSVGSLAGNVVTQINTGAGLVGGPITGSGTISIPEGGVNNAMLANSGVTVNAGIGLSGGGPVILGGMVSLANSGVLSVGADGPLSASGGQNPQISLTGVVPMVNLPNDLITNGQAGVTLSGSAISGSFSGTFAGNGVLPWQVVNGTFVQVVANNGYLLTNDSQVTVVLPASPNVGGIIRICGTGAGGWTLAQLNGQVIYGNNLAGGSTIGTTWSARANQGLYDAVASSADGTKLVAVQIYDSFFGSGGGQIYTSTDSGRDSWAARAPATTTWSGIVSSADGTKLAAIAQATLFPYVGPIYTSADSGLTWTNHSPSTNWADVASSADGTKLVAAAMGAQLYTSSDSGTTWIARDTARSWRSVASSANGTKLAAAVNGGQIYTSTDSGATWIAHGAARNWQSMASSADGTKLVAVVNNGQIYTSTDSGTNWSAHESSRLWQDVTSSADGTKLAAVVNNSQIFTSADSGSTWVARAFIANWQSIASSADGTKLVATDGVYVYTSQPSAVQSTTAGAAGYLTGSQRSAIELQYIGNGQYMVLNQQGTFYAY